MALVSDIQLQSSAVKPPNLDTSKKFSAEGLTATTAFAVTDAGAGTTVSTSGLITAKSSNDINNWIQTTKADGNVSLYLSNDARPDWALKVSGTASDAFVIGNSTGANSTCQYPALSIGTAGAVGIGKYGASNALDISYQNSSSGGVVITEATNNVATKIISEAASGSIGTTTNSKFGFRTNSATVGVFDTSGNFGIGTCAPGAKLDVRGSAIFNEAGADADFRIEGDDEANLFFVDASTDRIGVGTATPAVLLDVDNGGATSQILMCVNGCICAQGYLGEAAGHTIEDSGTAETQRQGLNFVLTNVGCVVDDSSNDATVVCINGANTCVPFLMADGSTSDPISLVGGSIGNQVANDSSPCLGGILNGCDKNVCCICCLAIKGCYFGDGSQLTGVSSVPSSFSGDCTIIGCSAGGNVAAGGAKIVLVGGNAGFNATTPSNVVVLGSSAALCMTTATDTVLIGTGSGRCVLTCAGNLALGAWSLYNECAGSFNTALGTCAGLTQKGATTNTFVGAYAGTAVTTGSGNVFVGYKAGCAATSGNCCLIIGNGTCDLITGDFNGGAIVACGTLTVGVNDTGHDVTFFGATSGCKFFWDESANQLEIVGTSVLCNTLTVGVNDTGHDVKFFGASSGAFMLYDESADTLEVRGPSADATTSTGKLKLTTALTDINDNDVLGRIDFAAPLEAGGTDAILAGGAIWAEAEATFTSSVNSTALVFGTNTSAAATERMRLDNIGNLGIANASPATVTCFNSASRAIAIGTPGCDGNVSVTMATCTNGNGRIAFTDSADNTSQAYIRYDHNINDMDFYSNGAERMRIDSTGFIGIGTDVPAVLMHLYAGATELDIQSTTGSEAARIRYRNTSGDYRVGVGARTGGGNFEIKSTSCTGGITMTALGNLDIEGVAASPTSGDGAAGIAYFVGAASDSGIAIGSFTASPWDNWIQSQQENGTVSDIVMQPRGGNVGIGTCSMSNRLLHVASASSTTAIITTGTDTHASTFSATNGSYAGYMFFLDATPAASSGYSFLAARSDNTSDIEFNLRGDGNGYADGSWASSGADYQEWFESTDGTELEVGKAVVLDGDKVRIYNADTDSTNDILGVTRPQADNKNSAVIGNAAWNHWTDKYLTDDWGVYLREDVTIWTYTEDDGNEMSVSERHRADDWVPPAGAVSSLQSVRKLNPKYSVEVDDETNYSPRSDRAEWNLIGLLGQIQIKAGEPTRPTWIKMKDISAGTELWMVR